MTRADETLRNVVLDLTANAEAMTGPGLTR
jgi:hypothetical protein